MNKISNREKSLLVALAIVAICVVSFMFVIKPILNKREEQKAAIAALEIEVKADKAVHDGLGKLKQDLEDCKKTIKESEVGFYGQIYAWQSEREVTEVFYKNNMVIKSIVISKPVPFEEKKTEEEKKVADPRTPEQIAKDLENSPANIVTVTVNYQATIDNLKLCLDDFAKSQKRAAITKWDYVIKEGKLEGNLTMQLYMLKD